MRVDGMGEEWMKWYGNRWVGMGADRMGSEQIEWNGSRWNGLGVDGLGWLGADEMKWE
jgi:hypothetical protein